MRQGIRRGTFLAITNLLKSFYSADNLSGFQKTAIEWNNFLAVFNKWMTFGNLKIFIWWKKRYFAEKKVINVEMKSQVEFLQLWGRFVLFTPYLSATILAHGWGCKSFTTQPNNNHTKPYKYVSVNHPGKYPWVVLVVYKQRYAFCTPSNWAQIAQNDEPIFKGR